jgi:hypothetical protein
MRIQGLKDQEAEKKQFKDKKRKVEAIMRRTNKEYDKGISSREA